MQAQEGTTFHTNPAARNIAMQITIVLALMTALGLEGMSLIISPNSPWPYIYASVVYAIIDTLRARHNLTDLRRPSLLTISQAVRIVGFTCLQVFSLMYASLNRPASPGSPDRRA